VTKNGSTSAAINALNGPLKPPSTKGLLSTFQSLHPQVGDPLPHPPPLPPSTSDQEDPLTPLSTFESDHMSKRRPIVDPSFPSPPSTTVPVQFTTEEFIKRARRGDNSSAGGLNGMNYRILKLIFKQNDTLAQNYTVYLNKILADEVSADEKQLLNTSRGVGLPKTDDSVRPISVGHIVLRMLGSMSLTTVSGKLQEFFAPIQFGVGIRNGCELMINAIRARLLLNENDICISCDAKNAFNSFDRSKFWAPLRKQFPSLEKFVRAAYLHEGTVVFRDDGEVNEVKSSIGSRQGCSLGSFLFCLAIHEELLSLQRAFPQLMIIAYCDDVYIVGEPKAAIQAYNFWSHAVATRLQGSLRDEKGSIYSTQLDKQQLLELGCPTSLKVCQDGIKVLGAPIGNDKFTIDFITKKVEQIEKDIHTIGYMTSHHAQWAVVVRSLQQRMQYIFRCVPCGNAAHFAPLAARYDEAILSELRRICHHHELPQLSITLAHLPPGLGGFGLKSWFDTADAAFLSAYLYSGTIIPKIFPALGEAFPHPSPPPKVERRPNTNIINPINLSHSHQEEIPAIAREAMLSSARITATCKGVPIEDIDNNANLRGIQSSITKRIYSAKYADLIHSIKTNPSERRTQMLARILSARGDSYTWYTVPCDALTTMNNCQTRIAALQRLLIPIITTNIDEAVGRAKITCPKCNVTSPKTPLTKDCVADTSDIDPYGYHLQMSCTSSRWSHSPHKTPT